MRMLFIFEDDTMKDSFKNVNIGNELQRMGI